MTAQAEAIGFSVRLKSDFEKVLEMVTEALKAEGFGVLTEIDVKATLKKKIDVDYRPYRILGACNPPLAYRALEAAPQVGLLLPCNITVDQIAEDTVEVSFLDPNLMMGFVGEPALQPIAEEANARLRRAAAALEEA